MFGTNSAPLRFLAQTATAFVVLAGGLTPVTSTSAASAATAAGAQRSATTAAAPASDTSGGSSARIGTRSRSDRVGQPRYVQRRVEGVPASAGSPASFGTPPSPSNPPSRPTPPSNGIPPSPGTPPGVEMVDPSAGSTAAAAGAGGSPSSAKTPTSDLSGTTTRAGARTSRAAPELVTPMATTTSGTLTGSVTMPAGASFCTVNAYVADAAGSYSHAANSMCTAGTYSLSLSGVTAPLSVKLSTTFYAGYNWSEWVGSTDNSMASAQVFTIADGATVSAGTFSPHTPAKVTGTVDLAGSGATTCSISVYVNGTFVSSGGSCSAGAFTAAVGWYPSTVTVTLQISLGDGVSYWSEWAGSTDNTLATAAAYSVSTSATSAVGSFQVHPVQRVSGTVAMGTSGATGCTVAVYRATQGTYLAGAMCQSTGTFTTTIPWPASVTSVVLQIGAYDGTASWHEWVGSTTDSQSTAHVYPVAASGTTSVGTITLHAPGRISGIVNLAAGGATSCSVSVYVRDSAGAYGYRAWDDCSSAGSFSVVLGWVSTEQSVKLQVSLDGAVGWWSEWVGSTDNTSTTATAWAVASGAALDVGTLTLHRPQVVNGTVDLASAGADSCSVTLYFPVAVGYEWGSNTSCSGTGAFQIGIPWPRGVASVKVLVHPTDNGWYSEWAGSSDNTEASAHVYAVAPAGSDLGTITLHQPQRFAGSVDLGSVGATECQVRAFDSISADSVGEASCAPDGTFAVPVSWSTATTSVRLQAALFGAGGWNEWAGSSDNTPQTATTFTAAPSTTTDVGAIVLHRPERVSGRIDLVAGASDCSVHAYSVNGTSGAAASCGADGSFTVIFDWSPTPVSFTIRAYSRDDAQLSWSEWVGSSDNTPGTARVFTVQPSADLSIGTLAVHAPQRITGRIDHGAGAMNHCQVSAFQLDAGGAYLEALGSRTCDASGNLRIALDWSPVTSLVKLRVTVNSSASGASLAWSEWLGSTDNTMTTAAAYALAPSATRDLGTIVLHQPGLLSGTVAIGAVGATGCSIMVYAVSALDDDLDSAGCTTGGGFLVAVDWGTTAVKLQVSAHRSPDSWREWAGSADNSAATATTFTVPVAGTVSVGTIVLHQPVVIQGTVTFPAGSESSGVTVLDASGVEVDWSWPNGTTGAYRSVVGFGTYRVAFGRQSGYYPYAAQFYNGIPEGSGLAAATPVTLAAGATRNGVDASLSAGGTITGRVLHRDGSPAVGVGIRAYTADGSRVTRAADTDANGGYSIPGLSTGSYRVVVWDVQTWSELRWSGNQPAEGKAKPVAVTLGSTTHIGDLTIDPPTFTDVPDSHQFVGEIAWLATKGISTGYATGPGAAEYRPANAVARDAMAAFMYRFAGKPAFTPPAASPFTDVPTSHPFYKEITWLAATGITTGYPQPDGTTHFKPTNAVARDAMAAFMHRFAGKPAFTPPSASPFTDVPTSHPFYQEVTWLAGTGITTGYPQPDGTTHFKPANTVARDAMAAFMYRYNTAELPTPNG